MQFDEAQGLASRLRDELGRAIIGQQAVPVLDLDTPETLHARIHAAEHELYPQCVAAIARGEISLAGRRVIWKNL